MLAAKVRFYLDENVQVAIAEQLQRRQIEVVTVRDLKLLGEADQNHLALATSMAMCFAPTIQITSNLLNMNCNMPELFWVSSTSTVLATGWGSWSWFTQFTMPKTCTILLSI